jgi:hypothetical protein
MLNTHIRNVASLEIDFRGRTELHIKAGLLTDRSTQPGTFPFFLEQWLIAGPLAAHSGATVRESHPLPFSLALKCEHLDQSE